MSLLIALLFLETMRKPGQEWRSYTNNLETLVSGRMSFLELNKIFQTH